MSLNQEKGAERLPFLFVKTAFTISFPEEFGAFLWLIVPFGKRFLFY
jgi:hypothetical protein